MGDLTSIAFFLLIDLRVIIMPLTPLSEMLAKANSEQYAVGYFESWDSYSFEAVLEAAEEENAPVVIGFGGSMVCQAWFERLGIEPLGAYGRVIAERAAVPVAFILNEVFKLDHVARGIDSGFNVVMLNSCHLPFWENVEIVRKVVELAKPHGVEVQAELGQLAESGQSGRGSLTDPLQAKKFAESTGVDFLAISVGNVHLKTDGSSTIDLERLKEIRKNVDVPLVIHGGSGLPDDAVKKAISNGVRLFHFGTLMKKAFLEETAGRFASLNGDRFDYQALVGSRKETDLLMSAKHKIKEIVKRYVRLYGSVGKASV